MRFPAYVPQAVQAYITARLYGGGSGRGWLAAKDDPAVKDDPGYAWIEVVAAFLQRFGKKDETIKEMFGYLKIADFSDNDYKLFMDAAQASLTDYGTYRDHRKKAIDLNIGIAEKAEELADLLDEIETLVPSGIPIEFQDVRSLLHKTDNPRDPTWRPVNRHNLTGKEAGENALYAWGIAPSLADLLRTVAMAADNYEPQFYGRIGAAIEKRERNPKTQFLRAFGHELQDAIDLTSPVLNAMACMATVAINDPDITVSSGDVKQALGLKGAAR